MNPILSICIPTYNRCAALKASLEVMTSDPEFIKNDEIEIVISDNASPDETQKICESFVKRFPDKIVYYRQPTNKGYSANLEQLTSIARGEYLKFINDCLAFKEGVLKDIFNIVKDHLNDKCLLFWGGNDFAIEGAQGVIKCNNANDFLRVASHATTWLGAYGFWKQDIAESLSLNTKYFDTQISQTAVFWHLFTKYRKAVVYHKQMTNRTLTPSVAKGGYNVAEVFGKNYFTILRDYKDAAGFSDSSYEYEKWKMFKNIIYPWYFDFKHRRTGFGRGNYFEFTSDYHGNLYYWISFALWPFFWIEARMLDLLSPKVRTFLYKLSGRKPIEP